MDALLLRSLQSYVLDTFGTGPWQDICDGVGHGARTFEPMLRYAPGLADRVGETAALWLKRPVETVWEDVGTYLVTHSDRDGVRRLLRFGGTTYVDFLYSLEELPSRARLALPDLDLPELALEEVRPDLFHLRCRSPLRAVQGILAGMLTAMADDYGVLCLISAGADGTIEVSVLDSRHAAAKVFDLAMPEV